MTSGIDSVMPASSPYGGQSSLAAYVRTVPIGATPTFWGRYFGPTDGSFKSMDQLGASDVVNECIAMKANSFRWIVPIASPGYNRISNGTYSMGYSDGQAACAGIVNSIGWSGGRLALPGNGHLRVYLDVEPGWPFSQQYWNGWDDAVFLYSYQGGIPFYPACYCNPADGRPCINFANGPYACDAVYANEPDENCPACSAVPGWAPNQCSSVYTSLWQYVIQGVCQSSGCRGGGFPPIDIDSSNPGTDETNYMLYLP